MRALRSFPFFGTKELGLLCITWESSVHKTLEIKATRGLAKRVLKRVKISRITAFTVTPASGHGSRHDWKFSFCPILHTVLPQVTYLWTSSKLPWLCFWPNSTCMNTRPCLRHARSALLPLHPRRCPSHPPHPWQRGCSPHRGHETMTLSW